MGKFTIASNSLEQMITWRRDFHRFPEVGWTEFRTASIIAHELDQLGFEVQVGKDVVSEERMGVPSEERIAACYEKAKGNGGYKAYMEKMVGGYTGVVGTINGKRKGPTIAFRFDMDALDILETLESSHFPQEIGFRSENEGVMHACGHDAHSAVGLGLATILANNLDQIEGTIKIIFQPAEEGVRGAKSMVEAGVVDDVDYFLGMHVGTGAPLGTVVAGTDGFLATTKIDATFKGIAAHAGAEPEKGRNALLAAASAILSLHAIPRHSAGTSRINVGTCKAGDGRNIVPAHAFLQLETRGENSEVHSYVHQQAISVLEGAALMYGTELSYKIVGAAKTATSSEKLIEMVAHSAKIANGVEEVIPRSKFAAGSEDATYMMSHVQQQGGLATYAIFGTTLAAGHHHEKFDIDEAVFSIIVDTWLGTIEEIYKEESREI
ncbi:amidohydrolase [Psychrobacillus antarcticus]|uniref:amidohydrolase n=1 Tax=Psychrobacillus antarcticus TaxID=2879115 RepID=UPI002407B74B|nr:amidohydrolase [Psychrobacillus antarcticus]